MDETNIRQLVAQLGGDQPNLELLSQLLGSRGADQDEDDFEQEAVGSRNRDAQDRAYEILRKLNKELSAACGACTCWGRHKGCSRCHGEGQPGHSDPDPALFREYIEPVLWRIGLVRTDLQPNK